MALGRMFETINLMRNKIAASAPDTTSDTANEPLPYGLAIFAEGVDPVVDIVAVHGLNGHRQKTWTANETNWLRDFLPHDLPQARVFSWGFDANSHNTSPISAQYLYDHARTLVSDLCLERKLTKSQERPIIFVAHSLGGIVVKSALIHSDAARQGALEEQRSVKLSTYGLLFMGTPHQGGNGIRLGELMLNIASIFMGTDNKILKHLERDSEWLQQQLGQYGPISGDFVTKFAYETLPTPITIGKSIMVVPKASAVVPGAADAEPIAIHANHRNMTKFASRDDPGYNTVSGHLRVMAEAAPGVVRKHWEDNARVVDAQLRIVNNFSVPFGLAGVPVAEHFIGREKELDELRGSFHGNEDRRQVVVLHGLGGIGKTQLAVAFLKQQREKYTAILWLNGKSEDTLKQSFAYEARRLYDQCPDPHLKAAAESKDENDIVSHIKRWLSHKANTKWLLVFDNVDNPKLPNVQDPQAYDVRRYFPIPDVGSILVTTRSSSLRIGEMINVRKFSDNEESIAILARMSERPISNTDPFAVRLAEKLDGLPLALATAGAYLNQLSISLQDYLRYYEESWSILQQESPELLSYEDRTMYTTWNLSYLHVKSLSFAAAELFRLWAYFDNQDLWFEMLASGKRNAPEWFSEMCSQEIYFNKAARILSEHALIEPLVSSNGYGMHGCVHSWTKYVLGAKQDQIFTKLATECVGLSVPDKTVPEYWKIEKRLIPHAKQVKEHLDACLQGKVFSDEETLHALHNMGLLYRDQDKIEEAEAMYQRALTGYEKVWGPEHIRTLVTVFNLGIIYKGQGRKGEAEVMYQRALTGFQKVGGPEHLLTLDAVSCLANLYKATGKMEEAEIMYKRALTGFQKVGGPEHTATLHTVNNLGNLYNLQGKMEEAEAMYRRALTGYERTLGPEHISTLTTVNNLGGLYLYQGKIKKAEAMYQRALTGKENVWGPEHTSTLNTVNNLGSLYRGQGEAEKAEAMYQRALTGYKKVFGLKHGSTLAAVHNLIVLYRDQGRIEEAKAMFRRALD